MCGASLIFLRVFYLRNNLVNHVCLDNLSVHPHCSRTLLLYVDVSIFYFNILDVVAEGN